MKKTDKFEAIKLHLLFWGSFVIAATAEGWAELLAGLLLK